MSVVAIHSAGAVELEKLPLKRDALHKHNLPIDIVSGVVGVQPGYEARWCCYCSVLWGR